MKFILKLRYKIIAIILISTSIVFLAAVGYISIKNKNDIQSNIHRIIDAQSEKNASKIEAKLNEYFAIVRTLGQAFESYNYLPKDQWLELINLMYSDIFSANESIYQIWDSWELQHIDSTYNKPYGRIANSYFRQGGGITFNQELRSMDGDPELYKLYKERKKELISDIYSDVFGKAEETKLMATLWMPVMKNDTYIGVVALDITLEQFQDIVNSVKIKGADGSYAFLLTHNAKYAGHPNDNLLNEVAKKNPTKNPEFNLHEKLRTGKSFTIEKVTDEDKKYYAYYSPIKIGETGTFWYLGIAVPKKSILAEANSNINNSMVVAAVGLLLLGIIIFLVTRSITNPIERITNQLREIAKGKIDEKMRLNISSGDEIEEISNALNTLILNLNIKNEFARKIGRGELNNNLELASKEDEFGKSLLKMHIGLVKAKEIEEKRRKEEEKVNWVNKGLAKFNDLFRENNDNLEELSYNFITELIRYINAMQGGVFILNDENPHEKFFELKACFAYDRRKFLKKRVEWGEGLIGACAKEKQRIYLTDIPDRYVRITSGLGDAEPNVLLLIPLIIDEKVLGVLEITSIEKIEKYYFDFLEKVTNNFASTIMNVMINMKTNRLLEESNNKSEKLSQQEEELRQNIEEMQSTKEESLRRETELKGLLDAINQTTLKAEYDLKGNMIDVNEGFASLLGEDKDDLIGVSIFDGLDDSAGKYTNLWKDVLKGKFVKDTNHIEFKDKSLWLSETYAPIYNDRNEVVKVMKLAYNITNRVTQQEELNAKEKELEEKHQAINNSIGSAEMDLDGNFISVNDKYAEFAGISKEKFIGKHLSSFMAIEKANSNEYKQLWENFLQGNIHKGGHQYFFNGKEVWLFETFTPVKDDEGNYYKILVLANDITKVRENETKLVNEIKMLRQKLST